MVDDNGDNEGWITNDSYSYNIYGNIIWFGEVVLGIGNIYSVCLIQYWPIFCDDDEKVNSALQNKSLQDGTDGKIKVKVNSLC